MDFCVSHSDYYHKDDDYNEKGIGIFSHLPPFDCYV